MRSNNSLKYMAKSSLQKETKQKEVERSLSFLVIIFLLWEQCVCGSKFTNFYHVCQLIELIDEFIEWSKTYRVSDSIKLSSSNLP